MLLGNDLLEIFIGSCKAAEFVDVLHRLAKLPQDASNGGLVVERVEKHVPMRSL